MSISSRQRSCCSWILRRSRSCGTGHVQRTMSNASLLWVINTTQFSLLCMCTVSTEPRRTGPERHGQLEVIAQLHPRTFLVRDRSRNLFCFGIDPPFTFKVVNSVLHDVITARVLTPHVAYVEFYEEKKVCCLVDLTGRAFRFNGSLEPR